MSRVMYRYWHSELRRQAKSADNRHEWLYKEHRLAQMGATQCRGMRAALEVLGSCRIDPLGIKMELYRYGADGVQALRESRLRIAKSLYGNRKAA